MAAIISAERSSRRATRSPGRSRPPQVAGEPAGALVEPGVGRGAPLPREGHGTGRALRLGLEAAVQQLPGSRRRRDGIPLDEELLPLRGEQERQLREAQGGVRQHRAAAGPPDARRAAAGSADRSRSVR